MNSPRWRGLRPWRAALALGVLGALAAGVVVHAAKRLDVDPATVSVSVEGCSLACADAFSHALGERLLAFGLRVVTSPQQGAPAVHLRIEQLEVGEGVHEDQARVVARATLSLSGTDLRESLLLEAESDDRDASLLEVALASLDMHGDDLAATILALPTIAPPDTALGLDRSDALRRARRALPARAAAVEAFRRRCRDDATTVALPAEGITCVSRCASQLRTVRAADGSAWVQLRKSAWSVPIGNPHDVQHQRLPGELARFSATGELASYGRISPDVSVAIGSRGGIFAFVAHRERASALMLLDGEERVLARVAAPRVLAQPAPSPSGESVALLSAEHARGVAHLGIVSASGGAIRDVFTYAESFRWVTRGGRELLLIRVSGADLATSPLARPSREDAHAPDAGLDAEGYEDEPDDYSLVEAGDPLAPPGPYAVLLDPATREVLARVGGRERLVRDVVGVREDALVATYATPADDGPPECGLLSHDLVTGEEVAAPTPTCLLDPVLLADGAVAGSAVATKAGDPLPTDREIVVYSSDGTLEVLTANDTDDLEPTPIGGDELGFTRRLPNRYARFPRSAACRARR